MKAGSAGGPLATAQRLAARWQGVSAAELGEALSCSDAVAHKRLSRLVETFAAVRGPVIERRVRFFGSEHLLQQWLLGQANRLAALAVLSKRAEAAALPAPAPLQVQAPAGPRQPLAHSTNRGVPGWANQGPHIRDGALDFKQYQHPASRAFRGGA